MKIFGGGTSEKCDLIFYATNNIAISKYNDKGELEIKVIEHVLKDENIIIRIPFLRGLLITLYQNNGISIFSVLIYICSYIIDKFLLNISLLDLIYIIKTFKLFFTIGKNKKMASLHGAEHMTINYYNEYEKVNLDDINKIKKSSIFSDRCGTNDYIIRIALLLILKLITNDFIIRYFLMIGLLYEMHYYSEKYKIIKCLFTPIYKLGILTQKLFFVRQPKDKDIEQAVKTILELEKYEDNKQI